MISIRSKRGMTLVELMSSLGILSLIGITFISILIQGIRSYSSGTSDEFATNLATIALQKLSLEIRDGRYATTTPNGALEVTYPALVTDPLTGEQIYDYSTENPVHKLFYVSNGNLIKEENGVKTIIAKGISEATFDINDSAFGANGGMVKITLKSNQRVGSVGSEYVVIGRVVLRNFR